MRQNFFANLEGLLCQKSLNFLVFFNENNCNVLGGFDAPLCTFINDYKENSVFYL